MLDVSVDTGQLSSRLLNKSEGYIEGSIKSLSRVSGGALYYIGPNGYERLFPSHIISEISSIQNDLHKMLRKLEQYSALLNSGPDEFADVDGRYKNELTNWWGRTSYHAGNLWGDLLSTPTVSYWVDNWQNKGWSYKTVQTIWVTVKAAPSLVVSTAGTIALWAGAGATLGAGTPVAALSTIYTANEYANLGADWANIWQGDFEEVGEVNYLKDAMESGFGDLGEMLGNQDAGELVGKTIYGIGDLVTDIVNPMAASNYWLNTSNTATATDEVIDALKGKDPRVRIDKIIQSDSSIDDIINGIKDVPKGIKGLVDVAIHTPISRIPYDLTLLGFEVPNLFKAKGAIDVAKDIYEVGADFVETILDNSKQLVI